MCEHACMHLSVPVRACQCVCNSRDLMVREREMERGLEREVEGWGGPLIWKVWCEWRTFGSPIWWILLHMQYGKVIHPSFSSFYLFPPPTSPIPYLSFPIYYKRATTFFPSSVAHITSSFLLLWLLLLVWGHGAAAQPQTLSSVTWEDCSCVKGTRYTHFHT